MCTLFVNMEWYLEQMFKALKVLSLSLPITDASGWQSFKSGFMMLSGQDYVGKLQTFYVHLVLQETKANTTHYT